MIEEGVMEQPHVDYAVGCHVWPLLPQGQIGVKAGPIMAAADQFDIKIRGKGGHAPCRIYAWMPWKLERRW